MGLKDLNLDPFEPPPPDTLPDGRWQFYDDDGSVIVAQPIELMKPCRFEDHLWILEFEENRVSVRPKDRHSAIEREAMRRASYTEGICSCYAEVTDNMLYGTMTVKIQYHDDSSPSGPWGPAEYGYYLTIEPVIGDPTELADND